eukprot:TRINITY_DN34078_c0_g2_i1.p1 TRINITY_DN34078_c0_g2~~TRINITY_DN34078_c0_g2_i1.p1  ORF type:complete len:682 (+),score=141.85 TRINITY_DN34078_c0_g2_i1:80-2047(+)
MSAATGCVEGTLLGEGTTAEVPIVDERPVCILVDRSRVVTCKVGKYVVLPPQLPPIDGSWRWIRKENDEVHRATRLDAGKLVREACVARGYATRCGGQTLKVDLPCIDKMLAGTRVLSVSAGLPELPRGPFQEIEVGRAGNPIDHAVALTLQGYKVATVNAAAAYHHGGGFTSGGRHALEEAFCSQTTLFDSLDKVVNTGVKPYMPEDGVILSPSVEIFRRGTDKGYPLMKKPVEIAAVVSVAMYNRNPRMSDSPVDAPSNETKYRAGVRDKFLALAHAAALAGADALIVPDVGCGVFGNDPAVVGEIAGEAIREYCNYFRLVVFTGHDKFHDAAINKVYGYGSTKPRLKHAAEFGVRERLNRCIVCEKPLDKTIAILLGPSGQRVTASFMHEACCERVAETHGDGYLPMRLPDVAKEPEQLFFALDIDGNGSLDKEEVRVVVKALWVGSEDRMESEFEKLWRKLDWDRSGNVPLDEFKDYERQPVPRLRNSGAADEKRLDLERLPASLLTWVRLHCGSPTEDSDLASPAKAREKVLSVFLKFDKNGDGSIDKKELTSVLSTLDPETWTQEVVDRLFSEADSKDDGRISAEEFLCWAWGTDEGKAIVGSADGMDLEARSQQRKGTRAESAISAFGGPVGGYKPHEDSNNEPKSGE